MSRVLFLVSCAIVLGSVVGCEDRVRPTSDAFGADGGLASADGSADAARSDAGTPADTGTLFDTGTPIDASMPIDVGSDAAPTPCDSPGTTETVACGHCGTVSRFCDATHVWQYAACMGEGVCAPGTTETMTCGRCGTEQAHCTTACAWDTTGSVCSGEGVCTPGDTSRTATGCPSGQTRALTCNATCAFDPGLCELDECTPGATTTAACGMCGMRTRSCSAMRRWVDGACTGEGACMPGTIASQACGRCGTQTTLCNTTCAWMPGGACSGEGVCVAGAVSSCATSCGSTGTTTCSATCSAGTCIAPAETCNGADDDCDTLIDEGCTTCTACAGSTPITGTGGRYPITLGPGTRTGSCGGAGAEGLLSITLTATSDVFVSTHGASIDTVVYARRCNCSGTELACADDSDGRLTSALRLTSLPAGNYTIVIDSETASSATVPVDVYISPSAAQGDRCGNPRSIAAGASRLTGNSCGLTNDYDTAGGPACTIAAAGDAEDAVYYFYVPTTSAVTFNGCNEGFSYDGTLYVRSVCNGAALATQVVCDDDSCAGGVGTCTSQGFGPTASVTLTPGLYYLFVDGYAPGGVTTCAQCGPFDITITGL
jgi:hypothetical protein